MSRPTDRREFLLDTAKMACGVGALGLGLAAYSSHSKALPAGAIRPPGAGTEDDFQSACIRCGLCVRDCPYDILKLATPDQHVATGTPFFVARAKPCEMCEDIPCVKACPTGALDHQLTDIKKAKMGLAVLVDHETCLNFLGLRCDVCYRVCPVIDKAITLDLQHNERTGRHTLFLPTVHSDACTGCGKCEASCVLEVAAIKVYPIKLAKGELGSHYRLGWEEKRKAGGKSLVQDRKLWDLPDRLPEGVQLPGHFDPGSQLPTPASAPVPVAAQGTAASGGIPDGLATLPGMPAPMSQDAPR
ncbi:MAG: ferredoxin-type protein NapG [Comamonadaceae bacterium CG1_02_60_18]|nr:MAG: ferredoxin-type protein NapG [Comamonadaceae bacterium CG1_02_60_18]PIQ50549.1 MAG: ferredoxin-type protein NapG [Comamonadaceae bacterium CG12_big_fil_rev_8_21_14_0_65_59_15]